MFRDKRYNRQQGQGQTPKIGSIAGAEWHAASLSGCRTGLETGACSGTGQAGSTACKRDWHVRRAEYKAELF